MVLKKMARFSALGAISPLISPLIGCRGTAETDIISEKRIILNVVCHGLFVLNVTDLGLELFTPRINDHIYKAGSWDWYSVKNLEEHKTYRLTGVRYTSSLPIPNPPDFNVNYSQSAKQFALHPEYSRFVVQLPFPEAISLVRRVDDGKNEENGQVITLKRFSLCQVLSYFVPDYRQLALLVVSEDRHAKIFDCKARTAPETGTANLHLWAEPWSRLTPSHAKLAYEKLSQLTYPLKLQLGTDRTVPLDEDPGVLGLSSEEEQGWSEWASGGEGSYPTNCSLMMSRN